MDTKLHPGEHPQGQLTGPAAGLRKELDETLCLLYPFQSVVSERTVGSWGI